MPRRASKDGGHSVSPTMTKKKPPSQQETLNSPRIARNAMGRRDTRDSGFITIWLKNRKQGAPLRIFPANHHKQEKEGEEDHSISVSCCNGLPSHRILTAVNTASTNGEATSPPSKSKQSRKHSGDAPKNTHATY